MAGEGRRALARWGPGFVVGLTCLAAAAAYFVPFWPDLVEGPPLSPEAIARVFFLQGDLERLAGQGQDLGGTLWTFDHVARMLAGTAGTVDPTLFVPFGFEVGRAQGFAWLDAVVAWPLLRLLGSVGFYNLWVLLVLAGNVLCLYLLFREADAPWGLALALAVASVWSPYVRDELYDGRPTQAHLWFLALGLQQVVRLLAGRGRPWVAGLAGGALLAAACFVYWFAAIPVIVAAGVAITLHLVLTRGARRPIVIGAMVMAATLVLLTVLPTWRVSSMVLVGRTAEVITPDPLRHVGVPGFLMLSVRGTGEAVIGGLGDVLGIVRGTGTSWGVLALGLGALVLPAGWRCHGPWALASLAVATLSWGVSVHLGGTPFTLPTASGLLEQVFPPLARCHFPERMMTGSLLAFGVAAALAGGTVWRRARTGRWPITGGAVLLLAVLAPVGEPAGTPRVMRFGPVPAYQAIAERWPGGIVEVPIVDSNSTYAYQIFHGQPLLGGPAVTSTLTRPDAHRDWCDANTLLQALEAVAWRGPPMPEWDRADLIRLEEAGFATIVLQPSVSERAAIVASVGGLVYHHQGYTVLSIAEALAHPPDPANPPDLRPSP
jgi:hypothetical protein